MNKLFVLILFCFVFVDTQAQLEKPTYAAGSIFPSNLRDMYHVDPQSFVSHNGQVYLAGTTASGWVVIFRSTDAKTWQQVDAGLDIKALTVGKPFTSRKVELFSAHNHLYVVVNGGAQYSIYKMNETRAVNWTVMNTTPLYSNSPLKIVGMTNTLNKKVVLLATIGKLLRSEDGVNFEATIGTVKASPNLFVVGGFAYFNPLGEGGIYEYNDLSKTARPLSNSTKIEPAGQGLYSGYYAGHKNLFLCNSQSLMVGKIDSETQAATSFVPTYTRNFTAHYNAIDAYLLVGTAFYIVRTEASAGGGGYSTTVELGGVQTHSTAAFITKKAYPARKTKNEKISILTNLDNKIWLMDNNEMFIAIPGHDFGTNVLKTAKVR